MYEPEKQIEAPTMQPIAPEIALARFNQALRNLLQAIIVLNKPEIADGLKNIYRKTAMAEILNDRYVIAVSGLQGVGKTTLMHNVYDFPDSIIRGSLAHTHRGEKLPILITEDAHGCYQTYVRRWTRKNDELLLETLEIAHDEFVNTAVEPGINDILLEIIVPQRIFHSPDRSFLLLPGLYQKGGGYWDEVTNLALTSSAACLFVFDATTYAKGDNESLVKRIVREFEDAKPLFALTKADQLINSNDNENTDEIRAKIASLKADVMNLLSVVGGESERVIISGTTGGTTDVIKREVQPQLEIAIGRYALTHSAFRSHQIAALAAVAEKDLQKWIVEIGIAMANQFMVQGRQQVAEMDSLMDKLDGAVERLRKVYRDTTRDRLNDFAGKPVHEVKEWVNRTSKETNLLTKLRKWAIGHNLDELLKFQRQVIDIWNTANGYDAVENQRFTINHVCAQRLSIYGQIATQPTRFQSYQERRRLLLGSYDENQDVRGALQLNSEMHHDLRLLFLPPTGEQNWQTVKFSPQIVRTVQSTPTLALECTRLATIFPEVFPILKDGVHDPRSVEELQRDFTFLQTTHGKIITGMGLFLGVDLAADGQIQSLPALMKALGMTGKIANGVLLGASAVLAASALAVAIMRQLAKRDIQNATIAVEMIHTIRDSYYERFMTSFDSQMDVVTEFIQMRLEDYYEIHQEMAQRANLRKALTDLNAARTDLLELCVAWQS